MDRTFKSSESMLKIILDDEDLTKYGGYEKSSYRTLDDAFSSDNVIVVTVAKLISGQNSNLTRTAIYNEVFNYLTNNLV